MEHNTVIRELQVWSVALSDCHCSNFPAPQHRLQPHLQLLPQFRGAPSFQDHLSAPGLPRHCRGHGRAAEDRQEPGNSEPDPGDGETPEPGWVQAGQSVWALRSGCSHQGTLVSLEPHWNTWSHGLIFTDEESHWFLWDDGVFPAGSDSIQHKDKDFTVD